MIIILISIAAVTGWSYALFQNSKISSSKHRVIEHESIVDALRVHSVALDSLIADKAAEIRHLKSTIQSLNDKSKATKKVDKVSVPSMKAESKPEVVKAASKKTYKKKSN
jgi:hypothetical protein